MEILLGIGLSVAIFFSAVVLPWINRNRIQAHKQEIDRLNQIVTILVSSKESQEPLVPTDKLADSGLSKILADDDQDPNIPGDETANADWNAPLTPSVSPGEFRKAAPHIDFEQHFGARLPVWIGGIALALAGFYLVKYSIENNLLSPPVRVTLGALLGIGLLYAGNWIRNRPGFANGLRIAQSLSGAGIAVMYVVVFASARLYHLIPQFAGFAGMAVVTATALVLSLRHGPPIALLGLTGGFLTPALLSHGSGDAFSLFVYLYFTASGLLIVVRKTDWWWLSIPTILACLFWVIFWLFNRYTPGDSIWLGLFLLGISATIIVSSHKQFRQQRAENTKRLFAMTSVLNYVGLAGCLLLMGIIAGTAGFGFMEWALFGLLALSSIGLAYFDDKLYGFVPWVSMAVNAVMLFFWQTENQGAFALTLVTFAALYMASGYFLMWRARQPLLWASLLGVTSLSYYLLAYYKLATTAFIGIPLFWGFTALALTGLMVYALMKSSTGFDPTESKQQLLAVLAASASSLFSLALFIELEREFLSVAVATEMLAIAWINRRVDIKALRAIVAVIAIVFGLLLLPQIILMVQLTAYSLVEAKLRLQTSVPIVQWPLFQLGLPAALFLLSANLLKLQDDSRLVKNFEICAIMLIAIMGYYFTRNSFHTDQNVLFIKAGFFERGVITNILFVYGLVCLWIGRRLLRTAFTHSGSVLCAVAFFRIGYFDLLIHNPLWDSQKIAGIAVFNALLLPYGLPLIWAWITAREFDFMRKERWASAVKGFMLLLLFALVTLNARHLFHGEYLNVGPTSNAEIYTYSAVWLVLGIGLLFGGIAKKDKMLRYASLGVILVAVGKVFLYDASELEGLYRVVSFFGLGLCLIGLSYLYSRFLPAPNQAPGA